MKFEQQACYQVSAQDNVATALGDIPAGSVSVTGDIGPQGKNIEALQEIPYGHKIALRDIKPGEFIIKYGVKIAVATQDIPKGAWVHLHNVRSEYDMTSAKMDTKTMILSDMEYAVYDYEETEDARHEG